MTTYTRNTTYLVNTCFNNNQTIVNVDTMGNPWYNNSMYRAFYNCQSLKKVSGINENVVNMYGAFRNCRTMTDAPVIPNSVSHISELFFDCVNLVNAPVIPNSVVNMSYSFIDCHNLVNAPEIPNSITNIAYAFAYDTNMINPPNMPDSVTSMYGTFRGCVNIVNGSKISNNVINCSQTYENCYNLISVDKFPNTVNYMSNTFYRCSNIGGSIYIQSENVASATSCFAQTTLPKCVYFPYQNNNVYTKTYNTFTTVYPENDINGTIYGNLIVNNGVVSNFPYQYGNYYVKLNNAFSPTNNSWEFKTKFKVSLPTEGYVYGNEILHSSINESTETQYRYGIGLLIQGAGSNVAEAKRRRFNFFCSSNGTSWFFDITGTHQVQDNIDYWLRCGFTGTEYYLDYSLDGTTWIRDITFESTDGITPLVITQIGTYKTMDRYGYPFYGEIDFNETSITMNGELWWNGIGGRACGLIFKDINEQPSNIKIAGILDDTDRVYSGFTANNYITLDEPFNPSDNNWEVNMKFTTSDVVTQWQELFQSCIGKYSSKDIGMVNANKRFGICVSIDRAGVFDFFCSADGTSWLFDTDGTYSILPNTTYFIRFGWTGAEYYLDYSLDGTTWIRDITFESEIPCYPNLINTLIGVYTTVYISQPMLGTIDLKGCNIKINNEVWWSGSN